MSSMTIKRLLLLLGRLLTSGHCQEDANHQTQEKEFIMPAPIFTPPGDFSLQMHAEDVPVEEILSEEIQSIIERMFQVAKGERNEDGKSRVMVGLAAPQIGYSKRIILVDMGINADRKELGSLVAYINPEIIWYSDEIVEGRESCYSVDSRIAAIVPRKEKIRIKAFDRSGMPISGEFSGFTARIFQHEVDHLNGIRFPDRIGSEGKLHWIESDEYEDYKKNPESWKCQCPWETWTAMKNDEPYEVPGK